MDNEIQEIAICEYLKNRSDSDILLDVRDDILVGYGTIPNCVHISMKNIKELYRLPKEKKIYVFCQKGEFSPEVVELLTDAGYDAYNLSGGYLEYLRNKLKNL